MNTLPINTIITLLHKYKISKAALFGSYARGTYDDESDVDILIEPPSNMGMSFIDLKHELEDKLKKNVDLVSYKYVNKYLQKYILSNQKVLI